MTVRLPVLSHPSSYRPIPLHSLPLRSVGGGEGGKDDPSMPTGMRVGRPLPKPQNNSRDNYKGAAVSRTARPTVSSCNLCIHNSMLKTQHHQDKTEKHPNQKPSGDDEKRRKNRCGAWPWCRCRARSTGRSRRACVGRREHKGNPKPPEGGLGFPSA